MTKTNTTRSIITLILAFSFIACGQATKTEYENKTTTTPESIIKLDTPKDALASYIKAIRSKDVELIKKTVSKKGIANIEKYSKQMVITFYEYIAPKGGGANMPIIGEEKIDGDKATVNVRDASEDPEWLPLELVREKDGWKFAMFDGMGG